MRGIKEKQVPRLPKAHPSTYSSVPAFSFLLSFIVIFKSKKKKKKKLLKFQIHLRIKRTRKKREKASFRRGNLAQHPGGQRRIFRQTWKKVRKEKKKHHHSPGRKEKRVVKMTRNEERRGHVGQRRWRCICPSLISHPDSRGNGVWIFIFSFFFCFAVLLLVLFSVASSNSASSEERDSFIKTVLAEARERSQMPASS